MFIFRIFITSIICHDNICTRNRLSRLPINSNKTYSTQSTDNNFLSLKEYNAEYSNGENPLKTNSQDYLSIPSYNKTYSAQPTDNNFLSLKEYNAEYSKGENPLNK
mgnify:CR=1 FL=1